MYNQGRHIYTFENLCKEDACLAMGDETTKIFLNARGVKDDVSDELKAFLDYVAGKRTKDMFVDKLEEAVQKAKKNREWRHDYMTLMMRERINYEKGKEEGREEGREEGIGIGEIYGTIKTYRELGIAGDVILEKIKVKFDLSEQEAEEYLQNV